MPGTTLHFAELMTSQRNLHCNDARLFLLRLVFAAVFGRGIIDGWVVAMDADVTATGGLMASEVAMAGVMTFDVMAFAAYVLLNVAVVVF